MSRKLGIWFFTFFLLTALPVVSQAAIFNVNVEDDPTPMAAPNGCSNPSINGGRCSLREAVLSANFDSNEDTIVLQAKTYTLTIPEAGTPETGDLDIVGPGGLTGNTIIKGAGAGTTIIKAAASLNDRVMEIETGSITTAVQISDLTMQDGKTTGDGGGLFAPGNGLNLTLTNCNFINNQATGNGGGLLFDPGTPVFLFKGGLVSGNKSGANGGGLALEGGGTDTTQHQVQDVVITNNTALGGSGGGIYHSTGMGLILTNVQVTDNQAINGQGGGVFAGNGGFPLSSRTTNSVFRNNKSTGNGGGFYGSSGGEVSIENTTFDSNQTMNAGSQGGGVFISNGGGIFINGDTFTGNTSNFGGGLYFSGSTGTTRHEITNSTFSVNHAVGSGAAGGGLWISFGSNPLTFNNVTIVGNTSLGTGGGIHNNNSSVAADLRNSIFVQNDSAGFTDDCAGIFSSLGFNIFGSTNDGDCEPDGQNVGFNPKDKVGDPKIGPLADNGGPTFTHTLLAGSPAIDGGDPTGCKDGSGANLTTDQRGQSRPAGAHCDIGALELGSSDLSVKKTANASTVNVGDNVTYTITVTNGGPNDNLNVSLTDTLPTGVTLVSATPAQGTCTPSGGTVACALGKIANGANAVVTVVVTTGAEGKITNSVTVSGSETDPNGGNNTATVDVTVQKQGGGGGGGGGGGCALTLGAVSHFNGSGVWGLGLIPILFLRRRGSARG